MDVRRLHESIELHISPDYFTLHPNNNGQRGASMLRISRTSGQITLENAAAPLRWANQAIPIYGVVGIISLATSDYLIVITQREARGKIDGHTIYLATDFRVLPISTPAIVHPLGQASEQYLLSLVEGHLHSGLFWFSYGWDVTTRLQAQASVNRVGKALWEVADDRFFWNKYLQQPFIRTTRANTDQNLSGYILPIMYGSFDLRPTQINRTPFLLCLISRRSRYRAGTRYFTRGLDVNGHVANFNETEQLVLTDASPLDAVPTTAGLGGGFGMVEGWSRLSFVQTRGSAPIGFAEINTLRYVPDLTIMSTPEMASAFRAHILEQIQLYGKQTLLNLVKSGGREKGVKDEYEREVESANMADALKYYYFDFHKECSKMRYNRISVVIDRLEPALREMGYFHQTISSPVPMKIQTGVVRSNCMDSLDRTNVAQASIAKWSLTRQLRSVGILTEKDEVEKHNDFMLTFRSMWADHGDFVALAYAGSPALKTDFTRTGQRTRAGMADDFKSAVLRYYKNNFTDGPRQDAFDLVTGAWIAKGELSRVSGLMRDNRDPIVRAMPFVSASLLTLVALIYPFASLGVFSLSYPLLFLGTLLGLSLLYIFDRGVEYVNWPKLNPPSDAIHYNGPGFRTGPQGRGKLFSKLTMPHSLRKLWFDGRRKTTNSHKLEEIEMGNGTTRLTSRKHVD